MRVARIVVLGVAVSAGGLAFMLAGRTPPPAPASVTIVKQETNLVDVLVAKSDIGIGRAVSDDDLAWQPWPLSAAGPLFIRRTERPKAIEELKGSIARAPFVAGEPMREQKLVKAGNAGFMSAILPSGMRAISTEISAETGVGGFILPNDRVDVLLTRRDADAQRQRTGDGFVSETVLKGVRVLAIDQQVEEKGGQKVVVGKTATLELTPRQTQTLAVSRQRGTLSLALLSLADSRPNAEPDPEEDQIRRTNQGLVTVYRGVERTTYSCSDKCENAAADAQVDAPAPPK
jgi:pilus assembly protein CpaB